MAAVLAVGLLVAPLLCLRKPSSSSGRRTVVAAGAPTASDRRARAALGRASRSAPRDVAIADVERADVVSTLPPTPPTTAAPPGTAPPKRLAAAAPTSVVTRPKPTTPPTTAAPRRTTTTRPAPRPAPSSTQPPPPPPAPKAAPASHSRTGEASYYGTDAGFCANNDAPMGAVLTVTSLANGRTITCKVESRGPYAAGRIVDLAKADFAKLSDPSAGVIDVRVTW